MMFPLGPEEVKLKLRKLRHDLARALPLVKTARKVLNEDEDQKRLGLFDEGVEQIRGAIENLDDVTRDIDGDPSIKLKDNYCSESGKVDIFIPARSDPSKICYILSFPGFTGDASQHKIFIKEATCQNLGVIAVTPKWADAISEMESANSKLIEKVSELLGDADIAFIRGVSFGSWFSLFALQEFKSIKRACWITPCSAEQLPDAVRDLGHKVSKGSAREWENLGDGRTARIVTITSDPIVKDIDTVFLEAIPKNELVQVKYDDHFTADDLNESCAETVRWFKEGK